MPRLARFAGVDHKIAPNPLRAPFSHKNWRALPEDLRLRNIRERLIEQVAAEHQANNEKRMARLAAKEAPAPAATTAPALAAKDAPSPVAAATPAPASRYVVPCARCGEFLPARSAQSVSVKCKTPCRARKAQPSADSAGRIEELLAKLRRDVQDMNTGAAKRTTRGRK